MKTSLAYVYPEQFADRAFASPLELPGAPGNEALNSDNDPTAASGGCLAAMGACRHWHLQNSSIFFKVVLSAHSFTCIPKSQGCTHIALQLGTVHAAICIKTAEQVLQSQKARLGWFCAEDITFCQHGLILLQLSLASLSLWQAKEGN